MTFSAPVSAFRDETPGDAPLVAEAHVAHRRAALAGLGWPAEALAAFCAQQHALQERGLAARRPAAERRMILADGVAIGRLCLDRTGTPWRILDLALLPQAQGAGCGSAAVRAVLAEADAAGVVVDLHVGVDNPRAEAFYRRLGFIDAGGPDDVQRRLARHPAGG